MITHNEACGRRADTYCGSEGVSEVNRFRWFTAERVKSLVKIVSAMERNLKQIFPRLRYSNVGSLSSKISWSIKFQYKDTLFTL